MKYKALWLCALTAWGVAAAAEPYDGDADTLFAFAQTLSDRPKEAAKWYEAAAQANHPAALLQMGRFYLNGTAVAADCPTAHAYFYQVLAHAPAGSDLYRTAEQQLDTPCRQKEKESA